MELKEGIINSEWDNNIRNHYVYAHYKADTNKLFYIGIGTHNTYHGNLYARAYAYTKSQRNLFWYQIYKKHGRKVVILYDNLTEKEAKEREIALIKMYGRFLNNTGILCNISGGGEGRFLDKTMCKKIYVYDLSGKLINEFNSCEEAASYYHLEGANVGCAANEKRKTCGGFQFRYESNKDHNLLHFDKSPAKSPKPIVCTNVETGEIKKFTSSYKFQKFIGVSSNTHIQEALHGKRNRKIVKGWEVKYA